MSLTSSGGVVRTVTLGGDSPISALLWSRRSESSCACSEGATTPCPVAADDSRSCRSNSNMCVRAGAAAATMAAAAAATSSASTNNTSKKRPSYKAEEQHQHQQHNQASLYHHQPHRVENGEQQQGSDGHDERDSKFRRVSTACAVEERQRQHQQWPLQQQQQQQPLHHQHHQHYPHHQQYQHHQHHQMDDSSSLGGGASENPRLKRNKPVKWSAEEDRRLREAVVRVSTEGNRSPPSTLRLLLGRKSIHSPTGK